MEPTSSWEIEILASRRIIGDVRGRASVGQSGTLDSMMRFFYDVNSEPL